MSQIASEALPAGIADANLPVLCPVCGMENSHDAIFCANPACDKALGDFRYVEEELKREARWHEDLAERVTAFVGKPYFLVVHITWIAVWIVINSGLVAMMARFDVYPYALLSLILAVESLFLSGSVLIAQNRENSHEKKRARLDYEVNVRTYRKIEAIDKMLQEMTVRMERLEAVHAAILPSPTEMRIEP